MKCIGFTFVTALLFGMAFEVGAAPTHRDLAYAKDDKSQKLDVYLPTSETPVPVMVYIHGGGWQAGSKNRIPGFLDREVAAGRLAVVSVEYRFTQVATHPAQVNDCLRAIQFVRANAKAWNIDPLRIGVTGGSAGAHLSLYVALHDDVGKAEAEDPVRRQSSRVSCAVSFAGPTDWSLLKTMEHKHPAYRQLIGYPGGTPVADMSPELMTDVSPVSFVSADDPPILFVHGDADDIVPIEHSRSALDRLKTAGVQAELYVVEGGNHGVAGAGDKGAVVRSLAFIRKQLKLAQ